MSAWSTRWVPPCKSIPRVKPGRSKRKLPMWTLRPPGHGQRISAETMVTSAVRIRRQRLRMRAPGWFAGDGRAGLASTGRNEGQGSGELCRPADAASTSWRVGSARLVQADALQPDQREHTLRLEAMDIRPDQRPRAVVEDRDGRVLGPEDLVGLLVERGPVARVLLGGGLADQGVVVVVLPAGVEARGVFVGVPDQVVPVVRILEIREPAAPGEVAVVPPAVVAAPAQELGPLHRLRVDLDAEDVLVALLE